MRLNKLRTARIIGLIFVLLIVFYPFPFTNSLADEVDIQLKKVYPKIITPYYGAGKNDIVFFEFSDPGFNSCTLNIYNLSGHKVREISDLERQWKPGPIDEYYLKWDARNFDGNIVAQGVYIYCFQTAAKTFNGTIIVAR